MSVAHSLSSSEPNKALGNQSPTKASPSSTKTMKDVVQQTGEQLEGEERLVALVQSIEAEMQRSGIRVDCSDLKTQLIRLQTQQISADSQPSSTTTTNDLLKVSFHFPSATSDPTTHPQSTDNPDPKIQNTSLQKPNNTQQAKPKDWASLFQTQGPSKVMNLCHYPELQQGDEPVVKMDETDLYEGIWSNCLVGYFLDGKMPFPLLSATARSIWKDHGRISIKQIGACYFFEFQDEETKHKV